MKSIVGRATRNTINSWHFKKRAVKYIARLNQDGSLDTGFVSGPSFFSPVIVVSATDGSGDVYVGSLLSYNGSTHNGIARLNPDRSLDVSFDTGTGFSRNVRTIVPANDGSGDVVYVGGLSISSSGATFENGPIRLNGDGSVDVDFNPGFRAGEESIALATDGSGDIYVAGNFTHYNSTPVVNLVRLTARGALVR